MAKSRWEKEGEIYLKVPGDRAIGDGGLERCLFAKMIPPFIQPRQYWLSVKIRSLTSVVPEGVMSYRMRGVNVPVPRDQVQVETDDVTGDEFMSRYAEEENTEVLEPDDASSVDVGIDGDSDFISDISLQGRFFQHRGVLGLPDKAVFTDANLIMYVDHFTRKGHIKKNKEIDEPGLLAIGMAADDVAVSTDWGDIMWGDDLDFETMTETLLGLMPKFESVGASVGTSNPTNGKLWMQEGFVEDTHTLGAQLAVWTRMTVRCDVYTHRANRIISVS